MKKIRILFPLILAATMVGCSTTHSPAPVVDRLQSPAPIEAPKPPVVIPKAHVKPSDDRGFYIVKKGDTLYRIALDLGQNYRDIIAWNDLSNPNDIKVDQVLRVLPPDAGSSAQTAVVTGSVVDVRPLAVPTVVAPNKTGPKADKRPYSEAALAELQKPDPNAPIAVPIPAAQVKTDVAKTDTKAQEKTPDLVSPEDEAVSWMWPADGKIIAGFDEGRKGIDITGKLGQPVMAAGSGKVMYAGSGIRGYGNLVIVKHTSSLLSAYAYNKTILVKEGQNVTKGQQIAEIGNSDADDVKLHFEIRRQGKPVDPLKFLPGR